MVPQVYAAVMLGTLMLFWLGSSQRPGPPGALEHQFSDQLKMLKDPKVLKYCQYYSIVFGGYVALSLWMVQYYVGEFGLDIRAAALLAACFSLPGGVLRAIGGVAVGQVRRAQRHLVGDVGELDLPVPAELPADRHDHPHRQRPGPSTSA
jgi:nitrate/nitrite transporter NarK